MYHVLVVDNNTVHLPHLLDLLSHTMPISRITIETTREVKAVQVRDADLVILSGGTGRSIEKNPGTFKQLIELVVNEKKPCIGICLGAEAMAFYFGAELRSLPIRRVGRIKIALMHPLSAWLNKDEARVYEFHKWYMPLQDIPELNILATSKDGIEIFHHNLLPMWGMQFHPELQTERSDGGQLFAKVVQQCVLSLDD